MHPHNYTWKHCKISFKGMPHQICNLQPRTMFMGVKQSLAMVLWLLNLELLGNYWNVTFRLVALSKSETLHLLLHETKTSLTLLFCKTWNQRTQVWFHNPFGPLPLKHKFILAFLLMSMGDNLTSFLLIFLLYWATHRNTVPACLSNCIRWNRC